MNRGVVSVALLVLIAGCGGHARMIRKDLTGGTLTLVGSREDALADARAEMQAHCAGAFEIVSEEEVPVGTSSQTHATARRTLQTDTRVVHERRLTYQCSHAASTDAAAPPVVPQQLALVPGRGGLYVHADAVGAEVWLDGKETGQVTPAQLIDVKPGVHEVEVRTATRVGLVSVEVFPGVLSPVRVGLRKPRQLTVTVHSVPSGANLELDGAAVGATPRALEQLEAGPHRLRLTHPERPPLEQEFYFSAAQPLVQLRLPDAPANQVRFFPVPFMLEYARNVQGRSWLGVQASLGGAVAMGAPTSLSLNGGATMVYRYQSTVLGPLGLGGVAGVGLGVLDNSGASWVGIHALAGATVRFHWLELELAAQYLTPVTFNGNDDPLFLDAPLVFRPSLSFVFKF
ncbi:MAG TPA: PEGA domain-containing protein [Archangium sp.]|nr:PEGA domain-containing protein [Archangium sp.]